jgi:hypothetical protein
MKLFLFLVASLVARHCEAFLGYNKEKAHPMLSEFAQAQTGILLDIGLDIPQELKDNSSARLYIRNLLLELQTGQLLGDNVKLPGSSGPNPTCSTGPLGIKVHKEGTFISTKGTQTVHFEKACWEMLWVEGRPAGSIVCGFHLPDDVSRNGAVLNAGNVYVTFPVFTIDTLETARAKKLDYEITFKKYKDLQHESFEKMDSTHNPFKKAMHFRNAAAANEKASLMRTSAHDNIPTSEDAIIHIGENLLLYKEGCIWMKSVSQMGTKDHKYVGTASLKN